MSLPRSVVAALVSAALVVAACGGQAPRSATTTLRVFAAASLRGAFTELAAGFERAHDDVDVEVTFAGSSALAAQILQGAPADVFAPADEHTMARVLSDAPDGLRPVVFARNRLALIVEPGNPESLRSVADLARPGLVVVVCAAVVPCGRLAAAALERAGVGDEVAVASFEEHVGAVRSKVELGEADAGIVYATDVLEAGGAVEEVDDVLLDDRDLEAAYPMAVLDGAPESAFTWMAYIRSAEGTAVLDRFGFLAP